MHGGFALPYFGGNILGRKVELSFELGVGSGELYSVEVFTLGVFDDRKL